MAKIRSDREIAAGAGLVLGKFLPPTRGHQFLIEFARQYVQRLHVLVCTLKDDPIDGRLRFEWVRRMFPDTNVIHHDRDIPQEPADHPDFWQIWQRMIQQFVPDRIDFVFASEPYGQTLADVLGAEFVPVDLARELMPISATKVQADPMGNWEMIPEIVRPHYVKRVCIFGPESTGKSRLAHDLARHFQTVYAWEYARPLLDRKGGRCDPDDLVQITRGQVATEDALCFQANRVIFCDTDPLTTLIWSRLLFGTDPPLVEQMAASRCYDLYLLLDVDVPWVDDGQRFFSQPQERRRIFQQFRDELDLRGRKYQIVRGDWAQRFAEACSAVEQLFRGI